MIKSIAGFEISIAVWCICHLKAGAWEEESEEIVGHLSTWSVVGCCRLQVGHRSSFLSLLQVKALFFSILPPFTHWLLCFWPNMWLKLIVWTSGNNRRQFLLEFDAWLNHTDTLMMSWQLLIHASLLAYLFVHLMIVTFSFHTWLAEIPPTWRYPSIKSFYFCYLSMKG